MTLSIREAMADANLFGAVFDDESWGQWRALLAGFYGEPLDDDEVETWESLTGRQSAPQSAHDELWLVVGRRGGKSQTAALMALYEALFRNHESKLSPGEVATVAIIAADRKQARSVFRYVRGLVRSSPVLNDALTNERAEAMEFGRVHVEITTASARATRGYTFGAVICDEIAYWRGEESADPDAEIINAVRPGLATLGGPLIALSSPGGRRGELWEHYSRHYGEESEILVAQAASRTMNPGLPEKVVNEALQRDYERASAEYLAEFRAGLAGFIDRDVLEPLVRPEPLEYGYHWRTNYAAFVDPSGGGADEFTLCIAHRSKGTTVIDVVRARKGTPADITREYANLLRRYGLREVTGDAYAGQWPRDEFRRNGITLHHSKLNRTELYQNALGELNSGRVELAPDETTLRQFVDLERRVGRNNRETIDHPPGRSDDRANAVAGAIYVTGIGAMPNINVRWAV